MNELSLEQKAQRALDFCEVQNVMGRHAYYHSVGLHLQELGDIWVKVGGAFAATASFGQNHGYWVGMDRIKQVYGDMNEKNRKKNLEKVSKLHPEVANVKENEGVGSLIMHTLTTPVIEVAGDGKTAKAMWYSPGQVTEVGADGRPMAMWMWEKYGVDLIKEDGKWKLWHIHMYTDFAVPPGKSWVDPASKSDFSFGDTVERPPEMNPDVEQVTYKEWSPTTVPQLIPMPVPYYTFSETFSYGP
jgi:SnoaL-like domain